MARGCRYVGVFHVLLNRQSHYRGEFTTSEKICGLFSICGHYLNLCELKMIVFTFQVTGFRSYVDLYVKDKVDEMGNAVNVVHEVVNERWEVCLTMSEKGFQQVSFVNSIATTKVPISVLRLMKFKTK